MNEKIQIEVFKKFIPSHIMDKSVIKTSHRTMFFPYLKVNLNGKYGKIKNRDFDKYHLSKITSIYEKPLIYIILDKENKMTYTIQNIIKYANFLKNEIKEKTLEEIISIFRLNFRFLKLMKFFNKTERSILEKTFVENYLKS